MDKLNEWLFALACLAGGFVGARIHGDATKGPLNFVLYVVVGFLCAIFGAPAIAEWAGLSGERTVAGLGFATAIFWMPLADRIRELIGSLHIHGGMK